MKRNKIIKAVRVLAVIAIILCSGYIALYCYSGYKSKEESEETKQRYLQTAEVSVVVGGDDTEEHGSKKNKAAAKVDFKSLKKQNPDVCGWISIDGIENADYPIVHRNDRFYLTHSWDGTSSAYGAIFMEELSSLDFGDYHTILYGHNMKNGTMFGLLSRYADDSFFRENGGRITVYTEKETLIYDIFSAEYVNHDFDGVYTVGFSPGEKYGEFISAMKARSIYDTGIEVTKNDRILTLSTCAYISKDRFTVHAVLVQQKKNSG